MSIQAVAWVLEHSKTKSVDRLVLIALANRVGREDGECWPAMRLIASDAGVASPSTVKVAIGRIAELGELEVLSKGDPRPPGRYRLPFAVGNGRSVECSPPEHSSARQANAASSPGRTQRSVQSEQNRNEPSRTTDSVTSAAPRDVDRVFEAYTAATNRNGRYVLSEDRRKLIAKRLRDYPVDDLIDACWGWQFSPHHRGENERHTVYNDLELILKNSKNVEKFRDLRRSGEPAGDWFSQ